MPVLTTAVQLYTDDFLAGFGMPDSPAFEEWQFFQREELRRQFTAALQSLIGWHRAAGEYDAPLAYARRWLAPDPLHEPAQRELMRLYAAHIPPPSRRRPGSSAAGTSWPISSGASPTRTAGC